MHGFFSEHWIYGHNLVQYTPNIQTFGNVVDNHSPLVGPNTSGKAHTCLDFLLGSIVNSL